MRSSRLFAAALLALIQSLAPPLAAQSTGGFAILRGRDTIAVETWAREDVTLTGRLERRSRVAPERLQYRATLVDDQSAPLVEVSAWRGDDPPESPARQMVRVIFKDDSAAVDEVSGSAGLQTRLFPTVAGAVPYLNLSMAWLEQATRRLRLAARDSLGVPFFNLGGGQTITGTLTRLGSDSALVRIGTVDFRLAVDERGRIRGGAVPAQGLRISASR